MSVQQEHLTPSKSSASDGSAERTQQPPELEFNVKNSEESLTAYISAIGGAVIGLLLTLLVLAIWNGGTLNFTDRSRIEALEASLAQVDRNTGAVSNNVDVVASRLEALQSESGAIGQLRGSLSELDANLVELDRVLSDHDAQLGDLDGAVTQLNVTRRNFETFTAALSQALTEMEGVSTLPAESGATGEESSSVSPVTETAAEPAPTAPAPTADTTGSMETVEAIPVIVASPEVANDAVLAYLFVDENGNGVMDDGEASLVGASIALMPVEGESENMATTTDAGALFEGVENGEYTLAVEDALGYELESARSTNVTVTGEGESGQIVYFPVASNGGE